jgi:uroporphyrinogen III methyltransferase/synthase
MSPPRAYFIGAGPGDAGLLTLRGAALLARADVMLYDARVHEDVLSRGPGQRELVGEGAEASVRDSQGVARRIVELVRAGKVVARVAASDPFLFSSGDEEVAAVARQGVDFEVVPGIVGAVAAGAYAGLALSRGADASASIALADVRPGLALHDWAKLANATDTLALLVKHEDVEETARTLVFYGRAAETPSAVLVDVARPTQDVIVGTLEDIGRKASGVKISPVRLIVGDVVSRRDLLRWFDTRPLFGRRVLVTRAREQAGAAADLLRERGAEPVVVPTIAFGPPRHPEAVTNAFARVGEYRWVAFTSANGVERSWETLVRSGRDARVFGGARIAAIGPATAQALEARGLRADVVAKEFKGEGLADDMLAAMREEPPAKVLLLRAERARDALPEALRAAGWGVDIVAVYETLAPVGVGDRLREAVVRGRLDAVTFSSKSTVDNLCDVLGLDAAALLAPLRVASIGPITTTAATERGVRVDVTAKTYTLPGLVDALEESYRG